MVNKFYINKNEFLSKNVTGYYHQLYTGYKQQDNPDFINVLKNTFGTEKLENLTAARNNVIDILTSDIPKIIRDTDISNYMCICVPRAKALNTYSNSQLMFKDAVKVAISAIHGVSDGTNCVIRIRDTLTTHLRRATNDGRIVGNYGDEPYPGITKDTCQINTSRIKGQNIILIDDIYTKNVNVDEDCIQTLFDNEAKSVIFYAIGYTRRK